MTIRACIRDMLQNAKGSVAELLIQIFLLQASKILESRQYTYIVRQLTWEVWKNVSLFGNIIRTSIFSTVYYYLYFQVFLRWQKYSSVLLMNIRHLRNSRKT